MMNLRTLQEIKDFIDTRLVNTTLNTLCLDEALQIIKISEEAVIKYSGTE